MESVLYYLIKKVFTNNLNENLEYDKYLSKYKELDLPDDPLVEYAVALTILRQTKIDDIKETVSEELDFLHSDWETINEDVPTNNVSGGNLAGLRGDPFRGKKSKSKVFRVNSNKYMKALMGKKKFESYSNYVGDDEQGQQIKDYAKKNPKAHIVLQDETTGACVFLRKHGIKD